MNDKDTNISPNNSTSKTSVGKRIVRGVFTWLKRILGGFFILLFAILLLLQFPFIQTQLGKFATNKLTEMTGQRMEIERIHIKFWNGKIAIKGVYIEDVKGDTLIHARTLETVIPSFSAANNRLVLNHVLLKDGHLKMHKYNDLPKVNIALFVDNFKNPNKKKKPRDQAFAMVFKELEIENTTVSFINDSSPPRDAAFQPGDMRIENIFGDVSNFHLVGDSIAFVCNHLSAREKSGLTLNSFQALVEIYPEAMKFSDLTLATPYSYLSGYYAMYYSHWSSFSSYIDSVYMHADLNVSSNIDARDIAYFARSLEGMDLSLRFRGQVKGPVNNIRATDMAIYYGGSTEIRGNIEMTGLPDFKNTFIYCDLDELNTSAYDISQIPLPPFSSGKKVPLPQDVIRRLRGTFKFSGQFIGFINDFTADGKLTSGVGNAVLDIKLEQNDQNKIMHYSGKLAVSNLNLGLISGKPDLLQTLSLHGSINGKGFKIKDLDTKFDGEIDQFGFKKYQYKKVKLNGVFTNQEFTGDVVSLDSNANFVFTGNVDFQDPKKPEFFFDANVKHLDLTKLNLMPTFRAARISAEDIEVRFTGSSIDNLLGDIKVTSLKMFGIPMPPQKESEKLDSIYINGGFYHINNIQLSSSTNDKDSKNLVLRSDLVDMDFYGTFEFIPLFNELKKRLSLVLPVLGVKVNPKIKPIDQNFTFEIFVKNLSPITELFIPKFRIEKSILFGNYNSVENELDVLFKSSGKSRLQYGSFKFETWDFKADNHEDSLKIRISSPNFYITDSISIHNFRTSALVVNDLLNLSVAFRNNTILRNSLNLNAYADLSKAPYLPIRIDSAKTAFFVQDTLWRVKNNNLIEVNRGSLNIENIGIVRNFDKRELLSIDGKIDSDHPNEPINIRMKEFPISLLNPIVEKSKLSFGGSANGVISFHDIFSNPYFTSNLMVNSLNLNKIPLGNLYVKSKFENSNRAIILDAALENNGIANLYVQKGIFYPFRKSDQFDIAAKVNLLDISPVNQFVEGMFSKIKGFVSGSIDLKGSIKQPELSAKLGIKEGRMQIDILQAYFKIESQPNSFITMTNNEIQIPTLSLWDAATNPGTGTFKGVVKHDFFKNISFDFSLTAQRLNVMRNTPQQIPRFYGTANVTGTATIKGPINNIRIAANMRTDPGTVVNIPIETVGKASDAGFIKFVNPAIDSTLITSIKQEVKDKNFTLDLTVTPTPDATVNVIFDETIGNKITVSGRSDAIRVYMDLKENFSLLGDYTITKGTYMFALEGIISKEFIVRSGSSITFLGDPYSALLNATAVYSTTAALYPIARLFVQNTQQQESLKRPVRVECELTLTNTLADPRIDFNLKLPNSNEFEKNILSSATSSEQERSKQVFSLLLLNQFMSPETMGGGDIGNVQIASGGIGTTLDLVAGQLNNWLSKLTPDVSFNLKYNSAQNNSTEPGTTTQTNRLNMGVTTQVFNGRLIIDGGLGVNTGNNNTALTNNQAVVGNVTAELKLTQDGQLRLRAYNLANDNNLLNQSPYIQAIGISFQREFNTWKDLVRKRNKLNQNDSIPNKSK